MNEAKSNALETAVLNHFLGISTQAFVGTLYLALFTTNPTDAATGTEVTGGSYAREAITFSAPSGGATTNSALIEYTNMPAATVSHWGIYTAASGGDMRYYGSFTIPKQVDAGDSLVVPASGITITEK